MSSRSEGECEGISHGSTAEDVAESTCKSSYTTFDNKMMVRPDGGIDYTNELHRRRLAWTNRERQDPEFKIPLSLIAKPVSPPKVHSYWSDIGIAGFRTVLDHHANTFRRLIWFIVLSTCFSLMLVQTLDRLNYYLARPVSTSVRFIRNDSLVFPGLTLCPYRDTLRNDTAHLNPDKLKQLYEKHFDEPFNDPAEAMYTLADIYDVHTLWTLTGWELEAEISSCMQASVSCTVAGDLKKTFTVLGYCLHYNGPPVRTSGHFYGFSIKLCHGSNHTNGADKFYLMVSDKYSTQDIRSLTHGFFLEHGWNKEIALSLKHFKAENKQKAPCSEDESMTVSRCISNCFQRTLVEKTGCRLPYMNMENITSIPYCNSSKQLANAEDIQMSLLWEGRGWHPDACGCGNKTTCSQYLYETSCDTYARHDRCARYEVYFTDITYEETREDFTYDIISLLCDIGGTLGLLLGASVLTMIQFVDATIQQLFQWFTRGRGRTRRQNKNSRVKFDVTPSLLANDY